MTYSKLKQLLQELRLVRDLRSENKDSRLSAVRELIQIRGTRALKALVRALGNTDTEVRTCAYTALVNLGHDAVRPLTKGLKSPIREVRKTAAFALGSIDDESAVKALIVTSLIPNDHEVAGATNEIEVRMEAIKALGRIASLGAISALNHVIYNHYESDEVQKAAISALQETAKKHREPCVVFDSLGNIPVQLACALKLRYKPGCDPVLPCTIQYNPYSSGINHETPCALKALYLYAVRGCYHYKVALNALEEFDLKKKAVREIESNSRSSEHAPPNAWW